MGVASNTVYEAELMRLLKTFLRETQRREALHQATSRFQRREACRDMAAFLRHVMAYDARLVFQDSWEFGT